MSEKRSRRPQNRQNKTLWACPVCESAGSVLEAHMLEEGQGANLLHLSCRKCQSALLVFVASDAHGLSSVSVLTDLSAQEALSASKSEPLSADEVLAFHHVVRSDGTDWIAEAEESL